MGLNVFALLHPLGKTVDTPPAWAQGKDFEDGLGNTLRLVLHSTPTVGVAVSKGSPVGVLTAAADNQTVTTDLSQSDTDTVLGASMVALSVAETLAGLTWHWVMTKGSLKEYKTGGRGVPLGDSDFNENVQVIDTILTDDSVVAGDLLIWGADNTWAGVAAALPPITRTAGVAFADDGGVNMDSAEVEFIQGAF